MILLARDSWEVKKTKTKGRGLFTKAEIGAGVVIGDYLGTVVRTRDLNIHEDTQNLFLMYYHDEASIYPNLANDGIHLVNHSCTPNACMYVHAGHTLFFALRHIFAGEELTVSYMLSPKDELCNPCIHRCKCESAMCQKSMHLSKLRYEKWKIFQELNTKKSKRKRIKYYSQLVPLLAYPKRIADDPIYNLFGNDRENPYKSDEPNILNVGNLRALIRETGRVIEFAKLNLKVCGIVDNLAIPKVCYASD